METDKTNKIFSILKNTSDCLILSNDNEKFIRKTYVLRQESLKTLIERQKLTHPNLITLNQLEFSHFLHDHKIAVDIIFEHYCRTLNECLIDPNPSWEDSEVINTFEPILNVVEYLIKEKIVLKPFSLKNIAITEEQEVKYIDTFLLEKEITQLEISNSTNNFNEHEIYAQIAENIFLLFFPKFSSKIWKNRLRILKEQKSSTLFEFVKSLIEKSSFNGHDPLKKKKIKKNSKLIKNENIKEIVSKLQKEEKYEKLEKDKISLFECNSFSNFQGKENKLLQ